MFFSVVIPALNEEIAIPEILTSIQNQTEHDYEVIVVDSGSKDKTYEKSKTFQGLITQLKCFKTSCSNVSSARNFGAKQAKGEFIVFFDADVVIEHNFLKEIKKNIEKHNLDATTVWNRSKEHTFVGTLVLFLLNFNMHMYQKIVSAANGPCIIIRRTLFETINGFDEKIVFAEDFNIMQRARKKGMNFRVFRRPILHVSTRRFDKEGFFLTLYKAIKALLYQTFIGPIRKPIFEYEMGGQYFKKK